MAQVDSNRKGIKNLRYLRNIQGGASGKKPDSETESIADTSSTPWLSIRRLNPLRGLQGDVIGKKSDYEIKPLADTSTTTQISTINVVLFGETGVGKSSVINLIAQSNVAEVSSNVEGCTMQSTRYTIPIDSLNFAIFDTIGLEEPQYGVNGYLKAIEKAYELIVKLSAAGGIHLLLFCMRGGRITATTQSNYRLFCECLCSAKVPIALVFTGLEREEEMEDWWGRNKNHIEQYGIKSDGHACITAVRDDTPGEDLKFTESQKKIRDLLKNCAALKEDAFALDTHSWFAKLGKGMRSFIEKRRSPKKKDVLKVLTQRCKLDSDTAKKIAEMMEKGDTETNAPIDGDEVKEVKDDAKTNIPVVGDAAKEVKDDAKTNIPVVGDAAEDKEVLPPYEPGDMPNESEDTNEVATGHPPHPKQHNSAKVGSLGGKENEVNRNRQGIPETMGKGDQETKISGAANPSTDGVKKDGKDVPLYHPVATGHHPRQYNSAEAGSLGGKDSKVDKERQGIPEMTETGNPETKSSRRAANSSTHWMQGGKDTPPYHPPSDAPNEDEGANDFATESFSDPNQHDSAGGRSHTTRRVNDHADKARNVQQNQINMGKAAYEPSGRTREVNVPGGSSPRGNERRMRSSRERNLETGIYESSPLTGYKSS